MSPAWLRRGAGVLAALALIALILSLSVGTLLLRDAALVQRVEPSAGASALFGDASGPGTPIGSPQRLIVRDPAAFLPGEGPGGARYVSETYLREQGAYPLQAKTVELVRLLAVLGSGAALLLFGGLWWWAGRRGRGSRVPS
ncbi:hypothetical protein SAMN04488058_10749 [Deinococcus reticulitermitis]|uniref:Uncharacterized protein n=1 Tax=Deinococcus reticulitermitis TaxID=856736 RepID=A0A1H6YMG7_9DEIO|nr:hypothetical protein [Deinococcus reticulitermitis]SEJ38440.1 hypothetical protein SAMN04488058_10749 [Deinococcus reticulitermitis]